MVISYWYHFIFYYQLNRSWAKSSLELRSSAREFWFVGNTNIFSFIKYHDQMPVAFLLCIIAVKTQAEACLISSRISCIWIVFFSVGLLFHQRYRIEKRPQNFSNCAVMFISTAISVDTLFN